MKNIFVIITLLVISLFFYGLTLKGVAGNPKPAEIKENLGKATRPFELSPERGRFILTYSLAENGSFALNSELGEAAAPDVGVLDDKYYVYFGPGVSMLALPFYLIGKTYNLAQVFSFATIILFASLNFVFIYLIGRNVFKLPVWLSLLSSLIFAFGSSSWSYAVSLYQHHVTTFFIISAFYAAWKYSKKTGLGWLYGSYIWLVFGYSIFVDYPNAVLLSPVIVYFFLSSFSFLNNRNQLTINWRMSFLASAIFFVLLIVIHGYYNQIHFGDWKKLSGELKGYNTVKREKELAAKNQEEKIQQQANSKSAVGFFKEERAPSGFAILLFSRDRGLFLYAPIFATALLGMIAIRKKINLAIATLLSVMAVNLLLYSSWGDPWGGWAFGPRYLIPSMSILAIFVSVWLHYVKQKVLSSLLVFFLFAYSSFVSLLGVLTTNQVPPKVEADFLKMKYNFLLNWDYFMDGRSSSFFFNEYAAKYFSLQQYFLLIYYCLVFLAFVILFVIPIFNKYHES